METCEVHVEDDAALFWGGGVVTVPSDRDLILLAIQDVRADIAEVKAEVKEVKAEAKETNGRIKKLEMWRARVDAVRDHVTQRSGSRRAWLLVFVAGAVGLVANVALKIIQLLTGG